MIFNFKSILLYILASNSAVMATWGGGFVGWKFFDLGAYNLNQWAKLTLPLTSNNFKGPISGISINSDGSLWAVTNSGNQIWFCNSFTSCRWTKINGALTSISTSGDSVCGVSPSTPNSIWCYKKSAGNFIPASVKWDILTGATNPNPNTNMKAVSVNNDGTIYALDNSKKLKLYNGRWSDVNTPTSLGELDVSSSKKCVCLNDKREYIKCKRMDVTDSAWKIYSSTLVDKVFIDVSVSDNDSLWAINGYQSGGTKIYYWSTITSDAQAQGIEISPITDSNGLPLTLSQITAVSKKVCALTVVGDIWCADIIPK